MVVDTHGLRSTEAVSKTANEFVGKNKQFVLCVVGIKRSVLIELVRDGVVRSEYGNVYKAGIGFRYPRDIGHHFFV